MIIVCFLSYQVVLITLKGIMLCALSFTLKRLYALRITLYALRLTLKKALRFALKKALRFTLCALRFKGLLS